MALGLKDHSPQPLALRYFEHFYIRIQISEKGSNGFYIFTKRYSIKLD